MISLGIIPMETTLGLETATYINDLNPTNPLSGDNSGQGDDHLRLIKGTLKNTFPNVTGPVTRTQAELNYPLPIGSIILWYSSPGSIPAGFARCNGQTVARSDGSGNITTPDLRGRVVVGLTAAGNAGDIGGADSKSTEEGGNHNHGSVTGVNGGHTHTAGNAGAHSHTLTINEGGNHNHGSVTGANGGHNHGGSVGNTSLSKSQLAPHTHMVFTDEDISGVATGNAPITADRAVVCAASFTNNVGESYEMRRSTVNNFGTHGQSSREGDGLPHTHTITAVADHNHEIPASGTHSHGATAANAGGHTHTISEVSDHNHTIPSSGTHTHTVDVRQAYMELMYIMKI